MTSACLVVAGPRRDWFTDAAWASLVSQPYEVTSDVNRVGVRLEGEPLERARTDELPSEGMVRGALQIPPSGKPVLFLADHPVTGGYPVIAYVVDDACRPVRPAATRTDPAAAGEACWSRQARPTKLSSDANAS